MTQCQWKSALHAYSVIITMLSICRLDLDIRNMPTSDAQLDEALAYIFNQFEQKYIQFCLPQHGQEACHNPSSEVEPIGSHRPEISNKSASVGENLQISRTSNANGSLASKENPYVTKHIGDKCSCSHISSEINHSDVETKQSDEKLSSLDPSEAKKHTSCSTSGFDASDSKGPISVSISISGTGTPASLLQSDHIPETEDFHQSQQKAGNTQKANQKAIFANQVIEPYRSRGLGLNSRCVTQKLHDTSKRISLTPSTISSSFCNQKLQNGSQSKTVTNCNQRTIHEQSARLSQVPHNCPESVETIQKSQSAALMPCQEIQNRKNNSCNWSPKRFILKSKVTLSQASTNTLQVSSEFSNQDTSRNEERSCKLIKQSSKELGQRRRGKQLSFMEDCQLTTLLRAVNHGHLTAKVICYKSHVHNYLCDAVHAQIFFHCRFSLLSAKASKFTALYLRFGVRFGFKFRHQCISMKFTFQV